MKKWIIALSAVIVIGGAVYTLYNYNKTNLSNTNKESQVLNKSNSSTDNNSLAASTSTKFNIGISRQKAADFKLKDLSGKEVSLSDFKGKRVFLNFFATWCPPCKAEMPEMEKLYEETKDSDLVILAVDLEESTETVRSFVNNNKYNFKVLLDSNSTAAEKYQISSIPTSYFIDKDGNIVDKHIGSMTIQDMKNYIDKLK
ncbi:TlpA family protein disulfide reductase [Candidatus Clostridium radicumherbarum]|uniref:TlpA family protein disulfide reductase n=1 Tax=Candidatus Clostridium radicumherbarum TaxID=3381662 RepID=A0ABW8TR87_9CLOT